MISYEDRTAITELLAMHGHLVDAGHLHRLDEVFTADVLYDVTPMGADPIQGLEGLRAAALALGDRNPVGHHVTNVVLGSVAEGTVEAVSKGLGITADGSCGSVTYEDLVIRAEAGWRISRRKIIPRRAPLGR
jgi:3-phenylpropionate/cinnamic acid dioxygenase small subunit